MMEMTVKARERFQDGFMNWQENRYRKNEARQQHADIRRSRMSCSANLTSFQQMQDWTGNMAMSPSGRFRVIEEKKVKQPLISLDGIRWNVALAALILIGFILLAIVMADLAGIGSGSRTIGKLNAKIESIAEKNDELRQELDSGTDTASICTEAVKLDLISSSGARTIRLTAPNNAQMMLSSASAAQENKELEGRLMSYAGD